MKKKEKVNKNEFTIKENEKKKESTIIIPKNYIMNDDIQMLRKQLFNVNKNKKKSYNER